MMRPYPIFVQVVLFVIMCCLLQLYINYKKEQARIRSLRKDEQQASTSIGYHQQTYAQNELYPTGTKIGDAKTYDNIILTSSRDLSGPASTYITPSHTVPERSNVPGATPDNERLSENDDGNSDIHVSHLKSRGSSVWCQGKNHTSRSCRFENLCYIPQFDSFVMFRSDMSVYYGVPSDRFNPTLLDASSIENHNTQYFNYVDLPLSSIIELQLALIVIKSPTLLMNRFNPKNLMHAFHDDLLPMFYTAMSIGGNVKDVQLVFMDYHDTSPYDYLYSALTGSPPLTRQDMKSNKKAVCFQNAFVGLTKETVWYQYGFFVPQGPVTPTYSNGEIIRHFTHFLESHLPPEQSPIPVMKGSRYIVLLSRSDNRLILNELELMMTLVKSVGVKILKVSLETHTLTEVIDLVSNAVGLVGMHGSLLILAMFLPEQSFILELFPYAIDPEDYTPYKTLANLSGMNLKYLSWSNNDPTKTVTHPNNEPEFGGISHLPEDQQKIVMKNEKVQPHLCCHNPEWFYRIYQDTIVDVDAVVKLVASVTESRHDSLPISQRHFYPSTVLDVSCYRESSILRVSWAEPWNLKFLGQKSESINYEILVQEVNSENTKSYIVSNVSSYVINHDIILDKDYIIWIRCMTHDYNGPFINSRCFNK